MSQVYIFSGLGADERVFKYLSFEGHSIHFVKWIMPCKNENIKAYAKRLMIQVIAPDPIFIGLSFGGIVAIEVARIIKPKQLILMASAKSKFETPFYYRFAGLLNLHKLLPAALLKKSSFITNWFFGINTKDDKKLLAEILADTDKQFLKWAIDKIVSWQSTRLPANCTHIHGTADRILPYRFVRADVAVKGGGHFMAINKSAELNAILNQLLLH